MKPFAGRRREVSSAAVGGTPPAAAALACPSCYTASDVRVRVYGPDLATNVFLTALPFLVLVVGIAALHRLGTPRSGPGHEDGRQDK
jgi:hypothetical protein